MAEAIVTTNDSVFEEMVAASLASIAELSRAARSMIFDVLPQAVEVVWPQQRTAGYGTGPKKIPLAGLRRTVGIFFGFYYGSELSDPDGLLEGTGTLMRHVKIRSDDDSARRCAGW